MTKQRSTCSAERSRSYGSEASSQQATKVRRCNSLFAALLSLKSWNTGEQGEIGRDTDQPVPANWDAGDLKRSLP